jgi:DNA-binding beta-propeller fold protein YncE
LKYSIIKLSLIAFLSAMLLGTCKIDNPLLVKSGGNYPEAVGKIVLNNCAVSGCHNDISKEAASGLSLTSWNKLFEGTRNGAAVIPYNHKQSTMFLFCNTYEELGVSVKPTMPIDRPALSKEEIITLRNWIDFGAPDDKGFVKFSDNANRPKYYVCNQGCDLITVFDAATDLPMRCFEVGQTKDRIESPHQVRVAPDGKHYYVIFLNGTFFQKFRTSDDTFVAQAYIQSGSWNTFIITKDSKYAFTVDYNANDGPNPGQGRVKYIDLNTMQVLATYVGSNLFSYPHAVALNKAENILYVFGQEASFFYKIYLSGAGNTPIVPDFSGMITLDQSNGLLLKPHDVLFTPSGNQYIISCQNTNEIRIYNTSDDKLVKVIPVGSFPQEIAISESKNLLFAACMEDTINFPGQRGSIAIIDLNNLSLIKHVYSGHQPHGVAVDDVKQEVIVTNRNTSSGGPAPHHSSECGGRNGYISFINLNSLELIAKKKIEVSVDPYFVSVKQ